jgi:NADH dehydrogenase FAD-containing subunit
MQEKERLNLYVSQDLLKRLEFCSEKYGVSRTQLAVMLIGQGLAGIEEAFKISNSVSKELIKNLDQGNSAN